MPIPNNGEGALKALGVRRDGSEDKKEFAFSVVPFSTGLEKMMGCCALTDQAAPAVNTAKAKVNCRLRSFIFRSNTLEQWTALVKKVFKGSWSNS